MSDSDDRRSKKKQKFNDDQNAGCSELFDTSSHLFDETQSTESNQSSQTTYGICDIIIERNNDQDKSCSSQIEQMRLDNAERNRLYRMRHREEINQRRREIRRRRRNQQETDTPSNIEKDVIEDKHAKSNNELRSNPTMHRQRRYYMRHREEINKRKRDSRLQKLASQSIPVTTVERNRSYRQRNKQSINQRRKEGRLHRRITRQSTLKMEHDIDIEENAMNDPRLEETFPGVSRVTDDDENSTQSTEYSAEENYTASDTSPINAYKCINKKINEDKLIETNMNSINVFCNSTDKVNNLVPDDTKDVNTIVNYREEFSVVIKKEINTCNTCLEVSEEETCKRCIQKNLSSFDVNVPVFEASVNTSVNNEEGNEEVFVKKEMFTCKICSNVSEEETCKRCIQNSLVSVIEVNVPIIDSAVHTASNKEETEEIFLKPDIMTCKVCSNESQEETCKRCIQKNLVPYIEVNVPISEDTLTTSDNYKEENEISVKNKLFTCNTCSNESKEETCNKCRQKCIVELLPVTSHGNEENTKEESGMNFYCPICPYQCAEQANIDIHLKKHKGAKYFDCDLCEFKTLHSSNLKIHIQSNHSKDKDFTCHMCSDKFDTKRQLMRHVSGHTGEKPFGCDMCEFRTSHSSSLRNHVKFYHKNERDFACDQCEFKTATRSRLKRHLLNHTGEKPFKCNFCDYRTSNNSHLKSHIQCKHTKEKRFSCEMCEFQSVTKAEMTTHVWKHSGKKPFKCEYCEYTSYRNNVLQNHIKFKHTNEKSYFCEICEESFFKKQQLNIHLSEHTGEKKYKCNICEFSCSYSTTLSRHIISKHTNDKKYTCEICQHKFINNSKLQTHMRKHTGEKPYKCDFCEYRTSYKTTLNKHVSVKHSNVEVGNA